MKHIILDTETTGLNNSRLVELAYSIDGAITFLRCKPPIAIELGASAVNHIVDEDVAHLLAFKDRPDYEAIKELLENNIVVAHNASFDLGVLEREGIVCKNFVCSKELAKAVYPDASSWSLQYLRHYLGIRLDSLAHSAAGDVQVLEAVWKKLNETKAN